MNRPLRQVVAALLPQGAGNIIFTAGLLLFFAPSSARRVALLVGDNYGGPGVDSLRFAETDARHFSDVLTRLAGFDSADVALLTDCDSACLDQGLAGMRSKLTGPDDLFLFYYSGHSDRDALRLRGTRYSLDKLRADFQAVPSQIKIGIFDACQSGMLTRFKGGTATKPISLESLKNVYGQVIIASSAVDERSQESDALEGSVFTHHWLNGLRGSADISGDRKVTLNEAYNYAYQMTIETTSRTRAGIQHPAYQFRIYGEGDIVLADLTQGRSGLGFGFRQAGKYLVVDKEKGRILADFYKGPDREMVISLPPGQYNVLKVEKDQWRVADATISENRVSDFNPAALKSQAQIVNKVKGDLSEAYAVNPEPPQYLWPSGPTRQWGASVKAGESAGLLGASLLYNIRPDLQTQLGAGLAGLHVDLPVLGKAEMDASYFGLIRKYEGLYFIDAGWNVRTTTVEAQDSTGRGSRTGWGLGLPVHFGIEIGPRQSVFATASIGYLWMVAGGGTTLVARTPGGALHAAFTTESGPSFGVSLGMYFF